MLSWVVAVMFFLDGLAFTTPVPVLAYFTSIIWDHTIFLASKTHCFHIWSFHHWAKLPFRFVTAFIPRLAMFGGFLSVFRPWLVILGRNIFFFALNRLAFRLLMWFFVLLILTLFIYLRSFNLTFYFRPWFRLLLFLFNTDLYLFFLKTGNTHIFGCLSFGGFEIVLIHDVGFTAIAF